MLQKGCLNSGFTDRHLVFLRLPTVPLEELCEHPGSSLITGDTEIGTNETMKPSSNAAVSIFADPVAPPSAPIFLQRIVDGPAVQPLPNEKVSTSSEHLPGASGQIQVQVLSCIKSSSSPPNKHLFLIFLGGPDCRNAGESAKSSTKLCLQFPALSTDGMHMFLNCIHCPFLPRSITGNVRMSV